MTVAELVERFDDLSAAVERIAEALEALNSACEAKGGVADAPEVARNRLP
jgi:hypothetical protein